ncbi:transcription factor IIA, alpha/beta subunit [Xylariaceae sp. FL0594]|nr:transcription factor IIA, alpha/beta subunit [Xylariaceae sp. FL0594]
MSNSQVGAVYQQIINDVIAASRVDFEEGGMDESVLEQLRQGWQKKLTQQQLAVFPWDPKPDPPPAANPHPVQIPQSMPLPTPMANSNANGYNHSQPATQHMSQHMPMQTPMQAPMQMPMQVAQPTGDVRVKTEPNVKIEPGLEGNQMPQSMSGVGDPQSVAQQRVIAQLQNQYGDRAAASINKLREQPVGGMQAQSQQRMASPGMPQPYPMQYQNNAQVQQQAQQHLQQQVQQQQQQQYRQNLPLSSAAQQQQQQQHQQQRPPNMANAQRPTPSQTDGSDEVDDHVGVLFRQQRNGQTTELGLMEIDNMLHAQIAARAKAMEGGGLMVPLERARKGKSVSYHKSGAGNSQFDGPGDDVKDEDDADSDEDAINSDLDDPEDNYEADDDDEEAGQIMLCMYDKVQRVKNKWKCVLKDGVLNVNGRDYVFHKATGEYEW